jgi:hypothetical protein
MFLGFFVLRVLVTKCAARGVKGAQSVLAPEVPPGTGGTAFEVFFAKRQMPLSVEGIKN